jgi:hypothetical protein
MKFLFCLSALETLLDQQSSGNREEARRQAKCGQGKKVAGTDQYRTVSDRNQGLLFLCLGYAPVMLIGHPTIPN